MIEALADSQHDRASSALAADSCGRSAANEFKSESSPAGPAFTQHDGKPKKNH